MYGESGVLKLTCLITGKADGRAEYLDARACPGLATPLKSASETKLRQLQEKCLTCQETRLLTGCQVDTGFSVPQVSFLPSDVPLSSSN